MKSSLKLSSFLTITIFYSLFFASCKQNHQPTQAPPVRVTATVVAEQPDMSSTVFSGTVASSSSTTVSFSVAGTITDIFVDEGQKVAKGQILAKVKIGDYVNADNIARAQLAEAKDAYERLKKLHDANALPEIKWVAIQNKLKQAENAAEISSRALDDATLRAPVTGVISKKFADAGQSVVPVEPIVEIVTVDQLTIDIPVSENRIGSIKNGQTAIITFKSLGIDTLQGKVTQKAVIADPLTRSYTVKVSVPQTNGKILPGMVGDVYFPVSDSDINPRKEIQLPAQAVLLDSDNRNFVWIVKGGKAERRFVQADELARNGVVINEGLMPGDTVIIEGMRKVGTGTEVEVLMK